MSLVSDRNLPFFLAAAALAVSAQLATSPTKGDVADSQEDQEKREMTWTQQPSADVEPPVDAAEAKARVEQELEEERFARVEQGFAQPVGGARPALIIVMVSIIAIPALENEVV